MAYYVGISEYINQGQHRRTLPPVDQEFRPKVHASINHSGAPSYNVI